MSRALLNRGTCWGEAWRPVFLPLDPAHYAVLADVLDDSVPTDWMSVAASVVIGGKGRRTCTVGPACGAVTSADDACIRAVHDGIMALGRHTAAPRGMAWMGIWIEHDFATGLMTARMTHGGPAPADRQQAPAAPETRAVPHVLAAHRP